MRFPKEIDDLEKVRFYGREHGYGNCIQYLQHAWMKELITQGVSPKAAAKAVGLRVSAPRMLILKEDVEARETE